MTRGTVLVDYSMATVQEGIIDAFLVRDINHKTCHMLLERFCFSFIDLIYDKILGHVSFDEIFPGFSVLVSTRTFLSCPLQGFI